MSRLSPPKKVDAPPTEWLSRVSSSPERKEVLNRYKSAAKRAPFVVVLVLSLVLNSLLVIKQRQTNAQCGASAAATRGTELQIKPPLSIGGQQCSSGKLEDLRRHLGNVVLIVNVNYDFVAYNTSSFLKEVYGRFFLDVVFIGPNDIPAIGVQARAHSPWRHRWCYAYYYFPTIVAKYPNADGYLWMNDDVVLNYWQLLNADTNKLWIPDTPQCWKPEKEGCSGDVKNPAICRCQGSIPFADAEKADIADGWSGTLWHKKLVRHAWQSLEGTYKVQHARSVRTTRSYQKRVVDIFYVPRRLSMTLAFKLMPSFVEAAVWSEVAIPMMFHALEPPSQYDPVFSNMVYRWERRHDYNPLEYWNSTIAAFHHWKLASTKGKVALLNAFKAEDPCVEILLGQLEGKTQAQTPGRLLTLGGNKGVQLSL